MDAGGSNGGESDKRCKKSTPMAVRVVHSLCIYKSAIFYV